MADPIFSAPTAAPDAAGGLPQAPKPLSSYAPKSLADYEPRRESSTALPLSAYEPGAERGKYTPKFRYAHRMQTDADFDGSLTAKRGAEEGRPDITADTVEELNLFGEAVPAETLRGVDGGERLLRIAGLNRKGRRGFLDALLKEGPAFDFVPFVGDLASAGIAVRDMVKVRDIFKKGTEQGFQNLSLEEKVLAKLYMEEGERSAKQTLGATVGSIVRQAPAFAVEIFAYGYGFKRLASAIGVGGAKRALYKAVANEAVGALREKGVSKVTAALGKKSMAQYVTPLVDDALSRAAMPAVSAAERAALIKSTAKSAQAALTLMSNPSRVKSFTNWAAEYATRGFVNHFDDVVRAMPPTVRGKLADAAGVAFVEAPVKGLMYGTFDAAVVNPIGARLMGAGEAVTETELGLGVSGMLRNADRGLSGEALAEANEETLRNAKFLAWGATVAEYASEVSGRAFTNLGGILTENIGGDLGRRAASRGLRAVAGRVAKADADIGSQVSKTIDRYLGKEATLGATLRQLREGVAQAAAKGGELAKDIPGVAGKSAQDILADGRLMDQVMKKYLAFKDKSFIGYWLANKAAGRGVTPQAVQRALEKMSYDDILGEFMEERYNGFAQGLFGLDGEEHEGMMQRLAHAAKEAVPTFQQGAAEIIAFALPVYGRAMANRAYYALGNSSLGKWEKAVSGLAELTSEGPAVVFEGSDGVRRFGVASTGKSGDKLEELKLRLGTVGASASNDNFRATTEEIANDIADAIPDLLRVQHGKTAALRKVGQAALKLFEFAVTGNPAAAFSDPAAIISEERFGVSGKLLLNTSRELLRSMYLKRLGEVAAESADLAGRQALDPALAGGSPEEAEFSNPKILADIRPRLVEEIQNSVRAFSSAAGNHIVTEKDLDSTLDAVFAKAVNGKVDGKTRDEFRKEHIDELVQVAQKKLVAEADSGSVRFYYNRDVPPGGTVSSVARAVEAVLARNHVESFIDLDAVADPETAWRAGQSDPMDEDIFRRAAAGDEDAAMHVANLMNATGIQAYSEKALAKSLERAKEYARGILAGAGDLLRPTFELGGATVTVEGQNGGLFLVQDGKRLGGGASYRTLAEAEAAAVGMGAERRGGLVYFTPTNGSWSSHASALIDSPAYGYVMSDSKAAMSLKDNPFNLLRDEKADLTPDEYVERKRALYGRIRLAEAYRDGSDRSAEAEAAYKEWLAEEAVDGTDGFETAAVKAMERAGIRRLARPNRKNESGFLFMPAALSYGGALYLPYKYLGDLTPVIEDSVETRLKDLGDELFRDPRPGLGGSWRPAARPLVAAMHRALMEVAGETASRSAETVEEAEWLARTFFNPDVYTQEGASHLVTAVTFMRGDDAAFSGGWSGVSAYYATLGLAARRVRATANSNALDSFTSLVGRLAGDPMLSPGTAASSGLVRLAEAYIPARFKTDPDSLRDLRAEETPFTPVADITHRAAVNLETLVGLALKGIPPGGLRSTTEAGREMEAKRNTAFVQAAQALEGGGNVAVYDEDLPWLLEELYELPPAAEQALDARIEALADDPDADLGAPSVEAVWAGAQARHRSRLGLLPDGASASMAAQTLRDYPFYVIQMARNMGLSLEVSPGDDRLREKLREIAGWWFGREGLAVPPDSEARFVSDVMEAVPPDTGRPMTPGQLAAAEALDHFTGALDALFGEAEESDPDVGGPEDTEGEGDDKERGQQADWASGLLRRTPEVGFFAAVMGRFFPHAQGHLAAITEALWLRQRAANGTVAPGSLMSLFDEAHWGDPETGSLMHPAFESPEAYADFLEGLPEKDDPVYGEAVAVLKTLGHKGGFVLADRLRGAYRQGIYQVTARIVPENASVGGADFRPLMRSAPASLLQDTKDGLLALARSADSAARIREASDTMRALAGKTPFLGLLEGETEPQRRERAEREIRERLADYGKVLSALLGPGNFVASGLLDPSVADRLTRGLMGGKGKTLSGLLLSAPSGRFPAVTVAGYLAERVSGAIGVLTDEREPDPEVRAAAAAAELTRGDMVASLFSRAGAEPLAAVGGFNFLANEIAAMTPVPSASRTGKGLKKVSGECSGRSAFLRAFLDSGDFASMYIAAGGRESDLPYARRAAVWPDGTPVESRVNGVLRRREVSSYEYDDFYDWDSGGYGSEEEAAADVEKDVPLPDPEEVKDAAEASHNTGTDPYTHALVYTMDKDTLIVNIPRAAFKSAGLSESPSYGEVVAYVAKALRTHTVSAKRASAWLAAGPSLAVPEARVAVVAPLKDGKLDKAAAEAWHGMYYYGERLGEYYRRQGFETGAGDLMSAKHTLAADGPLAPLYVKGQSHPAPSDSDLEAAPDRRFIRDLLAETVADAQGRERKLDALVDLDSLKQSVLTDAAVGGVPLIEYLAENPEAADDTEVALPDGGAVMLGALKNAAGLEVRVIETDGGPAAVFTFVTDLVTQQVGAPGHGARSELRKAATNHVSDCFDLCGARVFGPLADIQTAYLNAPAVRKAMVDAAVADLDGEEAAVLESALENGAGLGDPRIAALIGVKVAARIAKVIAPKTYGPYAVDKSPNGNIEKDTPAGVRRLHPYRAGEYDPLLPDERDRTEAESAAAGGLKRVAADTRFSSTDPFTRYGLRAKPGKFAGAAEAMEAVRILAEAEARASRSGSAADYRAYLATYKNTVLDKFTDGRGGELPPGAVYSFRDLVTELRDPRGSGLTPDPAAFREIDGTVVISGRLFMTGRTPSGNELRNEWVFRAFEPADTVVADGSRRYTYMKLTESGGKLRLVRAAVPAGMKATRDEAAGEGSPKVERISGRDNDGDHSDGSTIPVGRDMLAVTPMSEAERAAVLAGLADPGTTAERAADLLRTAEMAHASEMFILRSARRLTDDPNTEPVAANPFPEEAMSDPSVVSAAKTYDVTDAGSLAAWSKSNTATAESRGVIVASKAAVIAARQAGLRSPVVELAPGVRVGGNWNLPDGEFRPTLNALEAIANSTFDDIKVQIAGRAGFLPEILDLYSAAAASAGIKSKAEYVEFHRAFRGWMSGRTGAAILQVVSLVRRPTGGNGGYSSAARLEKARLKLRDQAKLKTRLGLTYMTLDFRHRPLVEGALLVGGEETALVLARALSVVEDLQAVKRVMDYAKAKASRPADVLRMDETVRRAGSVLDATDPGLGTVIPFGAGRALVERALASYKSKAEAFRAAFRGAAELSPWVLAVGTADGGRLTPGTAERLAKTALGWLPYRGVARITPGHAEESIRRLASGSGGEASVKTFMAGTEALLAALGRAEVKAHSEYAREIKRARGLWATAYRDAGGDTDKLPYSEWIRNPVGADGAPVEISLPPPRAANMALFSLVLPGKRTGKRIGLTGIDGSAASLAGVREGMLALRDGRDGLGEVTLRGVEGEFTGQDLYWALMHYAVLTGGAPAKFTRGNHALFPALFDGATQAAVAASVARDLGNPDRGNTKAAKDKDGLYEVFAPGLAVPWGRPLSQDDLRGMNPGAVPIPRAPDTRGPAEPLGLKPAAEAESEAEADAEAPAAGTGLPGLETPESRAEASAARVNAVGDTPESAAAGNLGSLAAAAAAGLGLAGNRRLGEFLRSGAVSEKDPGRLAAMRRDANSAGLMLASAAGALSGAPKASEVLSAAAGVITAAGYAEPTLIAGALLSAARASLVHGGAGSREYGMLRTALTGKIRGTAAWNAVVASKAETDRHLSGSAAFRLFEAAARNDPLVSGNIGRMRLDPAAEASKYSRLANTAAAKFAAAAPATATAAAPAAAALPESFMSVGKLGQPVRVYFDGFAGWLAESADASISTPITEAQALAYRAKAAAAAPASGGATASMARGPSGRREMSDGEPDGILADGLPGQGRLTYGELDDILADVPPDQGWLSDGELDDILADGPSDWGVMSDEEIDGILADGPVDQQPLADMPAPPPGLVPPAGGITREQRRAAVKAAREALGDDPVTETDFRKAFDQSRVSNTLTDEEHVLRVDNVELPSATALIGRLPQFAFDPEAVSMRMAGGDAAEAARIRGEWKKSQEAGTALHKMLEQSLLGEDKAAPDGVRRVVSRLRERGTVLTETTLWSKKGYAGIADAVVLRPDGSVEIYDLKTMEAESDPHNPRSHYRSDRFGESKAERHRLQMKLYASMVEEAGFRVSGTYIIPFDRGTSLPMVSDDGLTAVDASPTDRTEVYFGQLLGMLGDEAVIRNAAGKAPLSVKGNAPPVDGRAKRMAETVRRGRFQESAAHAGVSAADAAAMLESGAGPERLDRHLESLSERRQISEVERISGLKGKALDGYRARVTGGHADLVGMVAAPKTRQEFLRALDAAAARIEAYAADARRHGGLAGNAMANAISTGFGSLLAADSVAGALREVLYTTPSGYAALMTGLNRLQKAASRMAVSEGRRLAEAVDKAQASGDAAAAAAAAGKREAAADAAVQYLSALRFLRTYAAMTRPLVAREDGDGVRANPKRLEMRSLLEDAFVPPPGVAGPPAVTPAEQTLRHPELGSVDPSDTMLVAFVDTDAWFRGAVLPTFMGKSLRDVLLDKEITALVPMLYSEGNYIESILGIDSETGVPRELERRARARIIAGEGWARMARKGEQVGSGGEEVTRFKRRKVLKETGSVLAGRGLTEEELEFLRWYSKCINDWVSSRRSGDAVMLTEVPLRLAGLSRVLRPQFGARPTMGEIRKLLSIEESVSRVKAADPGRRVLGIHYTMERVAAVVPKAYHAAVEEAVLAAAVDTGGAEQAMSRALAKAGFAFGQERADGLVNVRIGLPCRLVFDTTLKSGAHRRLVDEFGRRADEIAPEALADRMETALRGAYDTLNQMSWTVNGDGRMFHGGAGVLPFFAGNGAVRHYAHAVEKPPTPEYSAEVAARRASLVETLRKTRSRSLTVAEAAAKGRAGGLFSFLADLLPEMSGAKTAAAAARLAADGGAGRVGITGSTTVWDAAKIIYQLSVRRLMESAWDGGMASERSLADAGFEAFNRAVETVAHETGDRIGLPGASYREVYDKTGALPLSLTAGELLAHAGKHMAEAVRFRSCLTRMLLTQDEDGMPLVYAQPGSDATDDTVPDRVWEMAARWWVDAHTAAGTKAGLFYDSTATGRDNAVRLYQEITPALKGTGGEQTSSRGVRRHVLTEVKKPDNMTTFAAISAMKNRAGDDTKSRMSVWAGGEAAAYVEQLLAVGGYGNDARLAGMNRFLTWSKSCSVMASFFFPIATALESPWAAVGFTPTVLGPILRKAGIASDGGDDGWLKKLAGNDAATAAPHMVDVLGMLGSDDPALLDLQMWGLLSNLSLADRARNMTDHNRQAMAKDIKATVSMARAAFGSAKAARTLQAVLEGAMEHPAEMAFEYVINATKIAVFAQMNARLRQRAIEAGRSWDPVRDMREWSNAVVNPEVGGIDPAMYPFMTPAVQSFLKLLMFSWEWTLGAWDAGGGNLLTRKWLGTTTTPKTRGFFFGRWLRMYLGVMHGIPLFMNALSTGIAKAAGEGDDDDRWLYWNNEYGKNRRDFDITPILRVMANKPLLFVPGLPTLGDIKGKAPGRLGVLPLGDWIPALTGDEGDTPTTGKRRYYAHLGKQGWEVAGWYENPVKSFLGKLSMPVQRALEGVFGISPAMGWDLPWKELGFWERWINLDPETSATINMLKAVQPFSFSGAARAPEAGVLSAFAPVSKGMSAGRAKRELTSVLKAWADSDSYAAEFKGRRGAWTDVKSMSVEWLEALRRNGYDPNEALSQALAAAREPLYRKVHEALPKEPGGRADRAKLAEAAAGLHRLNFSAKSLRQSIRKRDKKQNISRASDAELARETGEALRWALGDRRLGTARDAARGGDVRGFLATDDLPATVLGYRVVKPEELSEADLRYFKDNPQAAGHFDMAGGGGPARDAERAGVVDEILSAPAYKKPAPPGTPAELVRIDGTAKGAGYFGSVPYVAVPGATMTEQSIGHAHELRPLLVPTLTPDELVKASLGTPDRAMFEKADRHAADRLRAGKPVWARPGEQSPPHPGLFQMLDTLRKKKGTK